VHAVTQKGRGMVRRRRAGQAARGEPVQRGDGGAGEGPAGARRATPGIFDGVVAEAEADPDIVAITAAMPAGRVWTVCEAVSERCFDVG